MKESDYQTYMDIAKTYANFSKCQFTQVACIFVNEQNRIISTGVNGTIPGMENCCDHHFEHREDHVDFTNKYEIHAEENCILDLARSSSSPKRITVFTTLSPCFICLKHLLGLRTKNGLQIDSIIYNERYHRLTEAELSEMKIYAKKLDVDLFQLEQ